MTRRTESRGAARGLAAGVLLGALVGGCGAAEPATASGAEGAAGAGGEVTRADGSSDGGEPIAANQQGRSLPASAGAGGEDGERVEGEHAAARGEVHGNARPGGDREHPVPTCGPRASYLWVAREFQCPGGGNPFRGDPGAAQAARRGNVGAHEYTGPRTGDFMMDAHIVDVYDVPCPSGPVAVYVCMYHCSD